MVRYSSSVRNVQTELAKLGLNLGSLTYELGTKLFPGLKQPKTKKPRGVGMHSAYRHHTTHHHHQSPHRYRGAGRKK